MNYTQILIQVADINVQTKHMTINTYHIQHYYQHSTSNPQWCISDLRANLTFNYW